MEKECLAPRPVWERLTGKKIILAGNKCDLGQKFQEILAHINQPEGNDLLVSCDLQETASENYVLLFAAPEKMEDLQELLGQLLYLASARPKAAVLISDNMVYGKVFGDAHPLKTDEIGYACHTMPEDIPVTNLRSAEHFACRLAREEELNIRVARAERSQSGGAVGLTVEAAMRVLLDGSSGGVYNLPMQPQENMEAASPLSPMKIVTAESVCQGTDV